MGTARGLRLRRAKERMPSTPSPVDITSHLEPSEQPSAHLLSLPDDCLRRALSLLRVHDLLRAACTCRAMHELSRSNAIWKELCVTARIGGDMLEIACSRALGRMLTLGRMSSRRSSGAHDPDWRDLYYHACICDHRQAWRAFTWDDGLKERAAERTEILRQLPGDEPSISVGCSCRKCGRSFEATFTPLKEGEDGIDSFRTFASWFETAIVTTVRFVDKAEVPIAGRGAVSTWQETWLEEYYWQRARHQTLITLLLMLLFLWWWPADWEQGGYLEWPPFSSPSRWPAWTWEGISESAEFARSPLPNQPNVFLNNTFCA
mmetsp:Transcript_18107/g.54633  ORF Transcript_18107/g.54633 Transcript_18107/m.54633 type:complete len:319 (-) Transcript_18107:585-1541(-)